MEVKIVKGVQGYDAIVGETIVSSKNKTESQACKKLLAYLKGQGR